MKYTRTLEIGGNEWVVDQSGRTVRKVATYYGTSKRSKPTYEEGAREPDRLMETDTGKVFIFDEETKEWNEVKHNGN